jgi:hypothetical protein
MGDGVKVWLVSWCWGWGWLGMQWGCREGLGGFSTWRHQRPFPCTCTPGHQNPTAHDVVDEIRRTKTPTAIPAGREHTPSPWQVFEKAGTSFHSKSHRSTTHTTDFRRTKTRKAIATHTTPPAQIRNAARCYLRASNSESHSRD